MLIALQASPTNFNNVQTYTIPQVLCTKSKKIPKPLLVLFLNYHFGIVFILCLNIKWSECCTFGLLLQTHLYFMESKFILLLMIKYILTVFTVWKTDRINYKVNIFGNSSRVSKSVNYAALIRFYFYSFDSSSINFKVV